MSTPANRRAEIDHTLDGLAEALYEWSGGIFWRGETTWQDRHREEARQWFAYAEMLDRLVGETEEWAVKWIMNGPHPTRWTGQWSPHDTRESAERVASYDHVLNAEIHRRTVTPWRKVADHA